VFGEHALITREKRNASVRSKTYRDLLLLSMVIHVHYPTLTVTLNNLYEILPASHRAHNHTMHTCAVQLPAPVLQTPPPPFLFSQDQPGSSMFSSLTIDKEVVVLFKSWPSPTEPTPPPPKSDSLYRRVSTTELMGGMAAHIWSLQQAIEPTPPPTVPKPPPLKSDNLYRPVSTIELIEDMAAHIWSLEQETYRRQ
jgi:hypothetical protein